MIDLVQEYRSLFTLYTTKTKIQLVFITEVFVQHHLTIWYWRLSIILGEGKVNLEFVSVSQIVFIIIPREESLQLRMLYTF